MNDDYLIHDRYDRLTKSERKVADFVLPQGNKIIYATMTEIKAATGVGDATIIRFCQKLGFNGFSDFKIAIAKEDYTQERVARPTDYYDDIAGHITQALDATAQLINPAKIDQTVTLMQQAKHIYYSALAAAVKSRPILPAFCYALVCKPQPSPMPIFRHRLPRS